MESAVAQKRRQSALDTFFKVPPIDDDDLLLDLRTYPKKSGLLSKDELEIVESDADTLLHRIKHRHLSFVEVTKAFSKAAVVAQSLVRNFDSECFKEMNSAEFKINKTPLDKLCD